MGAQACLETPLAPQTPMDTMGKRYRWARRAELAHAQGDPALALDIAQRLVASAPGMSPGRVISFLWQLESEALALMGRTDGAQTLLQAAAENTEATGERFLLWRLHASLGGCTARWIGRQNRELRSRPRVNLWRNWQTL